jgi:hypothetical protein
VFFMALVGSTLGTSDRRAAHGVTAPRQRPGIIVTRIFPGRDAEFAMLRDGCQRPSSLWPNELLQLTEARIAPARQRKSGSRLRS